MIIARVKPYKAVSLDFLASQLNVSREDICGLLSELILEEKIRGEIDQLNGFLEMTSKSASGASRHAELSKWASSLGSLQNLMMKKLTSVNSEI